LFVKYQQIYARCLLCIKQVGICCQLAVSLKAMIGDLGIRDEGLGRKHVYFLWAIFYDEFLYLSTENAFKKNNDNGCCSNASEA